jgi:hypothetical protein
MDFLIPESAENRPQMNCSSAGSVLLRTQEIQGGPGIPQRVLKESSLRFSMSGPAFSPHPSHSKEEIH